MLQFDSTLRYNPSPKKPVANLEVWIDACIFASSNILFVTADEVHYKTVRTL